jgi:hypothetical protein
MATDDQQKWVTRKQNMVLLLVVVQPGAPKNQIIGPVQLDPERLKIKISN